MVKSYRDLLIWKKSVELAKEIYRLVGEFPNREVYGLGDQLKRASISVPSNIAEGQARQSTKEFKRFLYISLGSLAELDTQLVIAHELGLTSGDDLTRVEGQIVELRKMMSGLIGKLTTDH